MNEHRSAGLTRDPVIVLAADEGFAMPLAVTVRSILDHCAADRRPTLYILDGGITEGTKARLQRSWPRHRPYDIHWVAVDRSLLEGIEASGHVTLAAYYRILMPRLLPESVRRAIYFDSDLVCRADVGGLWDVDLGDHLCGAIPDLAAPYIDSSRVLPNQERCVPFLAAARPIPNFEALGLAPELSYFNSGVLLIDLDRWRNEKISQRVLNCLRDHRDFVLWWDQYALNVVLAGQWKLLDRRWNQGSHLYQFPTWLDSPIDQETFETLRDTPYVVHFSSPVKPWHPECRHPRRHEFFQTLDRTEWRGWRPPGAGLLNELCRTGYWHLREHVRLALRRTQVLLGGGFLK